MESKIKVVYLLTAVALMLLTAVQVEWLWRQYAYTVIQYEDQTVEVVGKVVEEERKLRIERRRTASNVLQPTVNIRNEYNALQGVTAILDVSFVDSTLHSSSSSNNLGDFTFINNNTNSHHTFEILCNISQDELFNALTKFILDENIPFDIQVLDSLLKAQDVIAKISTIKADSMVWHTSTINNNSLFARKLTVEIPYDNLQGEVIRVECNIPLSRIIVKMRGIFALSLLISLLIIYSFLYQIKTIRLQHKIDEVRRDFLHAMIHELKRPIWTMKMSISALKNNKMMENNDFKQQVLQNSYNELDNLTAYFYKLRDITLADKQSYTS